MRWFVFLVLLGSAGSALARTAVVRPAVGPVLQGQVRLTEQGIVVVNAREDLWQELALTNLAWAYFDAPQVPEAVPLSEGVPEPWFELDVGLVTVRGSTRHGPGVFTAVSSGLGAQGAADSVHYIYRRVEGETEILTHLASLHQTGPAAVAGLMMRESLAPQARQVMAGITPAGRGVLLWRSREGGPTQAQVQPGWRAPCWLKLKRDADGFVAYYSRNGLQWTASQKVALKMNDGFNAGLASASGVEWTVNWTTFDRVAVGVNLVSPLFSPRAELVSGSVVMGQPVSRPDGTVDLNSGLWSVTVPGRSISRLVFQWVSPEWLGRLPHDQRGVWLANGEYLEGDFRTVDAGKLRVSSVLYGAKILDANDEVLMVSLQRATPRLTRFQVTTVNGSVFLAHALTLGDNEVILDEPVLGRITLPIQELASITRP
jgi:hypothetical protein